MTRVTDLSSQAGSLALLRRTQARIEQTTIQVSSGRVSETYSGIAKDTARVISLQSDQARMQQYASDNTLLSKRLARMETNVASTLDAAAGFRTQLVSAMNATNSNTSTIQATAAGALEAVAALLNEQLDGKALFAGSRTDQVPVDLAGLPANGVFSGDAATAYYRGDGVVARATVADGQTLSYGVTADNAAFADLIQGLQMVKTADTIAADGGAGVLSAALDLVNKALAALPDVRSAIGNAQNVLDAATDRHKAFVTYATTAIGDVQNVDPAEALTQLNMDQAVLQASYSAIGRLSSLSIIDYLK